MTKTFEDIFEPAIPIVPAGWDVLPFEQAADVVSDKGKRIKQGSYLPAGAIPIIDQGQEPIGGYTNDQELAYEGGLPVVLFGDPTRSVKYVDRRFAVGAEGVKILRPNDAYVPKFFYYLLRSLQIPSRGYSRHFQFLRKFHFRLAPHTQQVAIVAEIEKQFSRLDEAVASLKRTKANLKRYKAAVLKAAVEGKLASTKQSWKQSDLGDIATSIKNGYSKKPDAERGTRIFRLVPFAQWSWTQMTFGTCLESHRIMCRFSLAQVTCCSHDTTEVETMSESVRGCQQVCFPQFTLTSSYEFVSLIRYFFQSFL